MSRDDNDSLGWTKVDRRARAAAASLADLYQVSPQHALGAMLFFWESCGERRELERLLRLGVREVVIADAVAAARLRVAWGKPVLLADFEAAGFLAPVKDGLYRVRGMSRYFDAVERSKETHDAKVEAGRRGGVASAEARKKATGTAQPPKQPRSTPEADPKHGGSSPKPASASASALQAPPPPEPESASTKAPQAPEAPAEAPPGDQRAGFVGWAQDQRHASGHTRELPGPASLATIDTAAQAMLDELGGDVVVAREAFTRYLCDPDRYLVERSPPYPLAVFLRTFGRYVPRKVRPVIEDASVTPEVTAWEAALDRLRGELGGQSTYLAHSLGAHCRPTSIDGETLVVHADDPLFAVWALERLPSTLRETIRFESSPIHLETTT